MPDVKRRTPPRQMEIDPWVVERTKQAGLKDYPSDMDRYWRYLRSLFPEIPIEFWDKMEEAYPEGIKGYEDPFSPQTKQVISEMYQEWKPQWEKAKTAYGEASTKYQETLKPPQAGLDPFEMDKAKLAWEKERYNLDWKAKQEDRENAARIDWSKQAVEGIKQQMEFERAIEKQKQLQERNRQLEVYNKDLQRQLNTGQAGLSREYSDYESWKNRLLGSLSSPRNWLTRWQIQMQPNPALSKRIIPDPNVRQPDANPYTTGQGVGGPDMTQLVNMPIPQGLSNWVPGLKGQTTFNPGILPTYRDAKGEIVIAQGSSGYDAPKVEIPSGQLIANTAPAMRDVVWGYADWAGQDYQNLIERAAMMKPNVPQTPSGWRPKRQRV